MKLRLFYQLRVIDSSKCNRKCAANWVYQLETGLRQGRGGGGGYWLGKKSLRAPSENKQALYLQRKSGPTEWMNCGKYNSSASSELKEIRR